MRWMMMRAETAKLGLLVASLLLCLGSLVTSQKSFHMGPRDLPLLQPQVQRFCKSIFKARTKCLNLNTGGLNARDPQQKQPPKTSTTACPEVLQQASHCERAVKQAYRTINMGGCPHELQDVTLCELVRCGGYHGQSVVRHHLSSSETSVDAAVGCVEQCTAVRKTLEACVTDHVQTQFRAYGILPQQQER